MKGRVTNLAYRIFRSPIMAFAVAAALMGSCAGLTALKNTWEMNELARGPAGEQGLPGPPGESIIGPPGPPGLDGLDGESIVGPPGDDGTDGTDGTDGLDGESIVGPPGPRGAEGPRGGQGDRGLTGPRGPAGLECPGGFQAIVITIHEPPENPRRTIFVCVRG